MADPDPISRTDASTERLAPLGNVAEEPLAGTGYRALALIGGGSQSEVYRAEHIKLSSIHVVKIMRAAIADGPAAAERMRVEAQTLARLAHDNLVPVIDFGVVRGRPYLVMDYLVGRTLREELAARRHLPVAEVLELARQLLSGLEVVHDNGLVHRDLHPGNIFLCENEPGTRPERYRTVKLLDFGGLKLLAGETPLGVTPSAIPTADGLNLGNPRYCAPEQISGKTLDQAADLYAVGAVLYRALAGREPYYQHEGLAELMRAKLDVAPEPVSRHAAQLLPHALDQLVMQALSREPANRPASARAFSDSLRRIADSAQLSWGNDEAEATKAKPQPPTSAPPDAPASDGPWLQTLAMNAGESPAEPAAEPRSQQSGERRIAPQRHAPTVRVGARPGAETQLLAPGQHCGPYEIVREVGRGAMGVVYLAQNAEGEQRAIKLLQLNARIRSDLADRFRREIQLLSYVDHVHVVRFYEAGAVELSGRPTLWVALEYLAGRTLREIVTDQGGQLGVERIVRWGRQVAQGVNEVHKLGVTHRDLKPENISIVQGDIAKVFDFGIAKYRAWGVRATDINCKLGTLPYMSPEQLDGSVPVDARSDVFALGLILHELATGRHPFIDLREQIDMHEAIMRQVAMPAARLDEVVPGFPADVAAIVDQAVAKQPDARQATMAELADALGAAIRHLRSGARAAVLDTGIGPMVEPAAASTPQPGATQPFPAPASGATPVAQQPSQPPGLPAGSAVAEHTAVQARVQSDERAASARLLLFGVVAAALLGAVGYLAIAWAPALGSAGTDESATSASSAAAADAAAEEGAAAGAEPSAPSEAAEDEETAGGSSAEPAAAAEPATELRSESDGGPGSNEPAASAEPIAEPSAAATTPAKPTPRAPKPSPLPFNSPSF